MENILTREKILLVEDEETLQSDEFKFHSKKANRLIGKKGKQALEIQFPRGMNLIVLDIMPLFMFEIAENP